MTRHSIPALALLLLTTLAPAAAAAPDAARTGAAPARTSVAPPAAALSPTPATRAAAPRRLGAEEQALRDVRDQGRREVAELVATSNALPDGPARRAIEHKIEAVKKQNRIEFLRVKVRFARERGDLAGAQEAEGVIDRLLNPRPAAPPAGAHAGPGKVTSPGGGR